MIQRILKFSLFIVSLIFVRSICSLSEEIHLWIDWQWNSVVVRVSLQSIAVHHSIALNDSGVLGIVTHNRRSVQVDLVVHNEQRIVVVDHIIVDAHTVKILLQQILKEQVLLLKGGFLFLNCQLVEVHFVEALVEVVKQLEFVLRLITESSNLLNLDFTLYLTVRVWLIERQDLLFLSFELSAKFCSFENSLPKCLVISQSLHALKTVSR